MVPVLMGSFPPSCSNLFCSFTFSAHWSLDVVVSQSRLVLRSACGCHCCYQSLQFLFYYPGNLGHLRTLVLSQQRDEAVIGHECPAFFVLVDDQLQGSIQASFWQVLGHLSSEERIANSILGGTAPFPSQGDQETVLHLI